MISQSQRFQALRMRAEKLVAAINTNSLEQTQQDISEVLHELHTYQIELELQNDELVSSQSNLVKMQREYRHLFEFAPVGYLVFNDKGIILDVNVTGLELLQVSRGRCINKPFLIYLRSREKSQFVRHLQTVIETGQRQKCDLCIQRKDGTILHTEIQSLLCTDEEDEEVKIRSAILDISERYHLEEELILEREKALEAASLMNEFLANMSHEIRTPLAGVIGFSEILEEELQDEHKEVAQIIANGGNRLLNTLNSVLDFARLRSKNPKIMLAPTNVSISLTQQCKLLENLALQKNLQFNLNIPEEDIFVLVDTGFLDRIVSNLITNAIKYTEQGSIFVGVETVGEWVEITISDTGIGIAEDFLPLIFEPFRQEQMGDSRSFEGVGLGLSITKRLVDLMEGEISVQSALDEGSTFKVRFLKLDSDLRFYTNEEPTREKKVAESEFSQCSVLVVEDNWETLLLVKRILKPLCEVKAVRTFDEAVKLYQKENFNVALIDVNLGEKRTGTDLLHFLQTLPGAGSFYSIAFTAYALPSDHAHFLAQGFDDYLPKPFTKANLLTVLERAVLSYA